MIYFISGHRDLTPTEFELYYAPAIRNATNYDRNSRFVVGGDCIGADEMAIQFLLELGVSSSKITIYTTAEEVEGCRLSKEIQEHDLRCYTKFATGDLRDMMMTRDSDADIAFVRPGKEDSYTAKNILRRYLMKE